ncbi:hypothetical protein RIF29_24727 [Crotalaria pallida]|uniref:Secreted protein n=1 Tax=Crotalaria pallida TaxID=3830 RepID=A0AAN9EL47_CROPI
MVILVALSMSLHALLVCALCVVSVFSCVCGVKVVASVSYMSTLMEQEYDTTALLWSAYNHDENGFESESRHFCRWSQGLYFEESPAVEPESVAKDGSSI